MAIFQIHRAGLEDVLLIAPLFDAYRQFYGQETDPDGALSFLSSHLSQERSVIFYATDSTGHALGFTQLYPSFSSVSMKPIWILNDLFVQPEERGGGIGRALMERARAHAEETKAKGLELTTQVDNIRAQGLYESLGYRREEYFLQYFLTLGGATE